MVRLQFPEDALSGFGATFVPNWMDWLMFNAGNAMNVVSDMVLFPNMVVFDSNASVTATLGRTSVVAESGADPLSSIGLELVVKDS